MLADSGADGRGSGRTSVKMCLRVLLKAEPPRFAKVNNNAQNTKSIIIQISFFKEVEAQQ